MSDVVSLQEYYDMLSAEGVVEHFQQLARRSNLKLTKIPPMDTRALGRDCMEVLCGRRDECDEVAYGVT